MLAIDDLRLRRGQGDDAYEVRLPALRLARGDVLAVVGGSGCGKSTLLEGVGLLLKPAHVQAYALSAHDDVAALWARHDESALAALRARRIGFVLQTGGLLPYLSVRDNILLPRRLLGMAADSARIRHAVDVLSVSHLLDKRPAQLSIGERQRVAVVRALSHDPDILLADEPTSALDPDNACKLFQLFIDLARDESMATLVVSHDWDLVRKFGLSCLAPVLRPGSSTFSLRQEP
ncbi:ABC transporter ATP-binding protein [Bordetella sp. LUAb4]|uniref:ABC transporter ATP-binding protein n=1 Tax=Bordetella sp. LUAb4 TaxID=2843195 RepID=UPI001E56F7A2|nr:ATP-binding cassette domain-containing protein [Bordetella sp. LUAb4]